jgi:HlyD family secretion protein
MRAFSVALIVALGGAGVAGYNLLSGAEPSTEFRVAQIESGPIVSAVVATGTVNAVKTVQVGSQLSGQIAELLADFNTPVQAGQIVARLNAETLEGKLRQSNADVTAATASLAMRRAELEKARAQIETAKASGANAAAKISKASATLKNAEREERRAQDLLRRGAASNTAADKAETASDTAEAELSAARAEQASALAALASAEASYRVVQAQIAIAEAEVQQKTAAMQQVRVDLDKAVIRSPIDGVVIQRSVDVGQTVAASLQAPTLFTIAQDLRQMEVHVNVDEADIGRVSVGQPVAFKVNAHPDTDFRGEVAQIRLASQTLQNVVTYIVVVGAPNSELKLLPGMTATVRIVTAEREKALKVPNAALRFRPAGVEERPGDGARVYLPKPEGGSILVPVQVGMSDGRFTEVLGGVTAGQSVIVGARPATAAAAARPRLGF